MLWAVMVSDMHADWWVSFHVKNAQSTFYAYNEKNRKIPAPIILHFYYFSVITIFVLICWSSFIVDNYTSLKKYYFFPFYFLLRPGYKICSELIFWEVSHFFLSLNETKYVLSLFWNTLPHTTITTDMSTAKNRIKMQREWFSLADALTVVEVRNASTSVFQEQPRRWSSFERVVSARCRSVDEIAQGVFSLSFKHTS